MKPSAALIVSLVGAAFVGCASTGVVHRSVVLPERCPQGPYCVIGQVDDVLGAAVSGVRCVVRTSGGGVATASTDADGFFVVDGLDQPAPFVQFEKSGLQTDSEPAPIPASSGAAAHMYVVLRPPP